MAETRTIRQIENKVNISTQTTENNQVSKAIELPCKSKIQARTLAMSLAGVVEDQSRIEKYRKLQLHPWYGQVIFQELTKSDREFISIFIEKTGHVDNEQFRITVQKLFIDDAGRPLRHALIQEVLSCL